MGLGEMLMQSFPSDGVMFPLYLAGLSDVEGAASSPSYWGQLWLARSAKYRLSSGTPCLSPSPMSSSGLRAPAYRDPRSSMWGESGLSPPLPFSAMGPTLLPLLVRTIVSQNPVQQSGASQQCLLTQFRARSS